MRVVKGAFATIAKLCAPSPLASDAADALARQGFRVLGVASGTAGDMQLAGVLALSDPPRPEAARCIAALRQLGVKVVIVTGDAAVTAGVIAGAVGVDGAIHPPGPIRDDVRADAFAVFAGVPPDTRSVCAGTGQMMPRRCARHKSELQSRPQPMLQSPLPASCSPNPDCPASSPPCAKAA
jgi:H+-transporting ATPase